MKPAAAQGLNVVTDVASDKHPERFVKNCAQRLQIRRFFPGGGPALQKSHLHSRTGIAQPGQIFHAARCRLQLKLDARFRQNFLVTEAKFVVGAPFGTGCHHDRARRQCLEDQDTCAGQDRDGGGRREPAPKSLQIISYRHRMIPGRRHGYCVLSGNQLDGTSAMLCPNDMQINGRAVLLFQPCGYYQRCARPQAVRV